MSDAEVIAATQRWISTMVIGLNLCPYAERVFNGNRIRYVVSVATTETALLDDLARELTFLASAPIAEVETTLLIHPHVFQDFLDYNDFLDSAEGLLQNLRLTGVIQLASFHPQYQFADTEPDDVTNYTNRSPFPMLHLLREASITDVALDEAALLAIPERNMAVLQGLGREKVLERLKTVTSNAPRDGEAATGQ